jgi:hypothetical protein
MVVLSLACLTGPRAAADVVFLQSVPPSARAGETLILGGQVSDPTDLSRLVLFYRVPGADWRHTELVLDPPDNYLAAIPGSEIAPDRHAGPSFVEYYVIAYSFSGAASNAFASPETPARIPIVGQVEAEPARPATTNTQEPDLTVPTQEPVQAPPPPKPPPASPRPVTPPPTPPPKPKAPAPPAPRPEPPPPDDAALASVSTGYPAPTFLSPTGVEVYTSERIQALGLRTLADLMPLIPGVSVTRDVQGFWHVTVRGRLADAEVIVLYDGQRLNNPYDGRVDWELPLWNVDRVEIQTDSMCPWKARAPSRW